MSAFGVTASIFWGGDWYGVSAGAATEGAGLSITETTYVLINPSRDNTGYLNAGK